jgi:hypothetical protein
MEGGRVGCRCIHRPALPRHRAIARRPKRCFAVSGVLVEFRRWPRARPIQPMVEIASGHQPPSVSATMEMKSTPAKRQAGRLDVSFRRTPKPRAWPGEEATSARVSCCSGEITQTSLGWKLSVHIALSGAVDLKWMCGHYSEKSLWEKDVNTWINSAWNTEQSVRVLVLGSIWKVGNWNCPVTQNVR